MIEFIEILRYKHYRLTYCKATAMASRQKLFRPTGNWLRYNQDAGMSGNYFKELFSFLSSV